MCYFRISVELPVLIMRRIIPALFCFCSFFTSAQVGTYGVTEIRPDSLSKSGTGSVEFTFLAPGGGIMRGCIGLVTGPDTVEFTLDSTGRHIMPFRPGLYQVICLANFMYPLRIDSLPVRENSVTSVWIRFEAQPMELPHIFYGLDKPVIYVYAPQSTEMDIRLPFSGKLKLTYPPYENSWRFTAHPGGMLQFGDKQYRYIFWDGELTADRWPMNNDHAFVVTSDTLLRFFEHYLSRVGFNDQEKQDFITYWYPRMQIHKKLLVRFLLNEAYAAIAPLHVTPPPDNMLRLFMIWSPVSGDFTISSSGRDIPPFSRKGLTLVEWGGSEQIITNP